MNTERIFKYVWPFYNIMHERVKLLTVFAKNLHRRCLPGLKIGFWLRVWNIELTLVLRLQIKQRKYSAGQYVWHPFWKDERSGWEICKIYWNNFFVEHHRTTASDYSTMNSSERKIGKRNRRVKRDKMRQGGIMRQLSCYEF